MRFCTKLSLGEKNEFRFHLWFLEFRVQGSGFRVQVSPLGQDMLVCKYFFIRGWVGFLFWFFEIFEFLFFLMVVRVVVNLFASLLLLDIHWKKGCCWDTHLEHPSRARTSISKNFYYNIGETVEISFIDLFWKISFLHEVSCGEMSWATHLLIFCFKNFENLGYFCSALVIVFGIRSKS